MAKLEVQKPANDGRRPRMAQPDVNKTLEASIKKIGARGVKLGEGFVLIKIDVPKGASLRAKGTVLALEPQQLPGVPPVSSTELEELLARFAASRELKANSKRGKPANASKTDATSSPQENQAFLTRFAANEMANRTRLEKQGELVSSQALADQMGITRQAITKAVKDLRMFALDGIAGQKLYPAFFADPTLDRSQLSKVSKELGQLAGPSKWQFFTSPRSSLGRSSPIDALRKGKFADVLVAATAFKEA